jgi:1-deoxy-D-xylulose-5-phosphate reductoisomerase
VLNAANEVAVQAFLNGRIGFLDIASTVSDALDRATREDTPQLDDFDAVLACDAIGRRLAGEAVARLKDNG